MRKPRVMPHANKSMVSTSARSLGRSSAKQMKGKKSGPPQKSSEPLGFGIVIVFGFGFVLDLLMQAHIIQM